MLLDLKIHPGLRIVMMNGVFVVPVLCQVFRSRRCQAQGSWGQCFIFILALILEFAGIGMLTYKASRRVNKGEIAICHFVVLDNFFFGTLVVLISHCGIAVFSESVECCFFLTILDNIENYPSSCLQ